MKNIIGGSTIDAIFKHCMVIREQTVTKTFDSYRQTVNKTFDMVKPSSMSITYL